MGLNQSQLKLLEIIQENCRSNDTEEFSLNCESLDFDLMLVELEFGGLASDDLIEVKQDDLNELIAEGLIIQVEERKYHGDLYRVFRLTKN